MSPESGTIADGSYKLSFARTERLESISNIQVLTVTLSSDMPQMSTQS